MADIRYDQEPALTGSVLSTDIFCISRSPYGVGAPFQKVTMAQVAAYIATTGAQLPLWNASTNTPTLASSTLGPQGFIYLVDVQGTTNLNGISTWSPGDYAYFTGGVWTRLQMIESARAQTMLNKTIQSSGILASAALTDGSDITKQWKWNLSALTASTQVVNTFQGAASITWPSGTYTISTSSSGPYITPYVVGLTASAPYTSINTAIVAANAAATSVNRCLVYIQPGKYTEDLTFLPNVDVLGLAGTPSLFETDLPVHVSGIHTFNNSSFDTTIQGISFTQTGASGSIFSDSTTNSIVLNLSNCYVAGNGITSSIGITNINFRMLATNSFFTGSSSCRVFNCTGGYYNLTNCNIVSDGSTYSEFLNAAQVITNGCFINDPLRLSNTVTYTDNYSVTQTPGTYPNIYLNSTGLTVELNYTTFNVGGGYGSYLLDGITNGPVNLNLPRFDLPNLINPALNILSGITYINGITGNSSPGILYPFMVGDANVTFPAGTYSVAPASTANFVNFVYVTSNVTVNMVPGTKYTVNYGGTATFLLPASFAAGDVFGVCGLDVGMTSFWQINQNVLQEIIVGGQRTNTGTGGNIIAPQTSSIIFRALDGSTMMSEAVLGSMSIT